MAPQAERSGQSSEEVLQAISIARHGIRSLGTPEEVTELSVFLCTPKACHIHGTATSLDGGATKSLS
ncbi:MAG TPA: SDR family oxidoreductase [Acidimicrobiia bacterium]|nr:SDR family oxidoreductase [Acidimicrobiia bacterium]